MTSRREKTKVAKVIPLRAVAGGGDDPVARRVVAARSRGELDQSSATNFAHTFALNLQRLSDAAGRMQFVGERVLVPAFRESADITRALALAVLWNHTDALEAFGKVARDYLSKREIRALKFDERAEPVRRVVMGFLPLRAPDPKTAYSRSEIAAFKSGRATPVAPVWQRSNRTVFRGGLVHTDRPTKAAELRDLVEHLLEQSAASEQIARMLRDSVHRDSNPIRDELSLLSRRRVSVKDVAEAITKTRNYKTKDQARQKLAARVVANAMRAFGLESWRSLFDTARKIERK